jgi:hypothetical protein
MPLAELVGMPIVLATSGTRAIVPRSIRNQEECAFSQRGRWLWRRSLPAILVLAILSW